jgi:integrase
VITPEEYEKLLATADPNFGRVITALRQTGCRPGEVRTLIWEWVDMESKLWIIPDHKTVTGALGGHISAGNQYISLGKDGEAERKVVDFGQGVAGEEEAAQRQTVDPF